MLSKAEDKSKRVSGVTFPVSMFSAMLLWTFTRAGSVEWNCLQADWKTLDRWLQFKWTFKWQDMAFSNALDMNEIRNRSITV